MEERGFPWLKAILWSLLGLTVIVVGLTAGSGLYLYQRYSNCPLSALHETKLGENSRVYAANGKLLGVIPSATNRDPLSLGQMTHWLPAATVAVEDRRFFHHGGIDYRGIVRAALDDLAAGRLVEGGSTITQQLVRNLYIGDEKSFDRKFREICLSIKIERKWGREKVLTDYLNQVYYGAHAYGVEAAAETYFSKHASQLSLTEAALIAGLPQAPSQYDPLVNPDAAAYRRNEVLQAMYKAGQITSVRYQNALTAPLGLRPGRFYQSETEPLFFNYVYDQVVAHYGAAVAAKGGLRIYTTLDLRKQQVAKRSIRSTLNERHDPAAALVSIDPRSGAIEAMAAVAPGSGRLQFNLASQGRRQAGSSFKPFALVAALERGIDPWTTDYLSAPFSLDLGPGEKPWQVATDDHVYYGHETLADAMVHSDNTVYARLTLDLGPKAVADAAHALGITTYLRPVASIALGTNPVSPLEMASAYATIADGGVYTQPRAILKVVLPDGSIDREFSRAKHRRAISTEIAAAATQVLEGVITHGTGTAAAFGRPAAGKTGTTSSFTDAWFVGFTPQLATSVWVGYPHSTRSMLNVHGIQVFGGTFPAEIWHSYMQQALSAVPVTGFSSAPSPPYRNWTGRFQFALSGSLDGTVVGEKAPQAQTPTAWPAASDAHQRPAATAPATPATTTTAATTVATLPETPPETTTTETPPATTITTTTTTTTTTAPPVTTTTATTTAATTTASGG